MGPRRSALSTVWTGVLRVRRGCLRAGADRPMRAAAMRVRPLTIVVPLLLAGLVAATFGVALTVLRQDDPAPPAPRPTAQPAPQAAAEPQEEPVAAPATPRALFAETCGGCHTLADAGTAGQFGPDLDAVRPSAADVRRMLRTGSLDGVMQPDLLQGAAARRVAAYLARVAGHR